MLFDWEIFDWSIPALIFINPKLCSTITTPLSVDKILLDSFIIACISPGSLFKSFANFWLHQAPESYLDLEIYFLLLKWSFEQQL